MCLERVISGLKQHRLYECRVRAQVRGGSTTHAVIWGRWPLTMRILRLSVVVAFVLAGSSCRLTHNVVRTTIVEPLQYSRDVYEKVARKQFIELAESALDQAISLERAERDDYQCAPYTVDYEQGFVDGFVDYLEAGGTGEPPLLPPRRYWNASYQSHAGHQSAEQWFAGYRHGAEIARASSFRSLVTIPLSDAIVSETRPYTYGRLVANDESRHRDEGDNGTDLNGESDKSLAPADRDRVAEATSPQRVGYRVRDSEPTEPQSEPAAEADPQSEGQLPREPEPESDVTNVQPLTPSDAISRLPQPAVD